MKLVKIPKLWKDENISNLRLAKLQRDWNWLQTSLEVHMVTICESPLDMDVLFDLMDISSLRLRYFEKLCSLRAIAARLEEL
jgi:hypothetical protein